MNNGKCTASYHRRRNKGRQRGGRKRERSNERSQYENVHRRTKLREPVLEYLPVSVAVVRTVQSPFFPVPGRHWFTSVLRDPLTPPLVKAVQSVGLTFPVLSHICIEDIRSVSPTYMHCATSRKVASSVPDGVVGKL